MAGSCLPEGLIYAPFSCSTLVSFLSGGNFIDRLSSSTLPVSLYNCSILWHLHAAPYSEICGLLLDFPLLISITSGLPPPASTRGRIGLTLLIKWQISKGWKCPLLEKFLYYRNFAKPVRRVHCSFFSSFYLLNVCVKNTTCIHVKANILAQVSCRSIKAKPKPWQLRIHYAVHNLSCCNIFHSSFPFLNMSLYKPASTPNE